MSAPAHPRIALDGHCLGSRAGGNESYVAGLLEGLAGSGFAGTLILYVRPGTERRSPRRLRVVERHLRTRRPWLRLAWEMPAALRRDAPDFAHFQYVGPIRSPCPLTIAVHDTSFLAAPQLLPRATATRLRLTTGWSVRRAAAVVVPCNWTADSLLARYPEAEGKVHVVPLAASSAFSPETSPDAEPPDGTRLPERFILYAGRRQRRKGVELLLRAYAEAVGRTPELPPLVLVGPASPRDGTLRRLAGELGVGERLRVLDFATTTVLRHAYRRAEFLCYPCRFEGFGLPVVEAFACGCPVLAADEAGLPETVGDAGWLLPAASVSAWADAIVELAADGRTRRELARRGTVRSGRFSWERTAASWLRAAETGLAAR